MSNHSGSYLLNSLLVMLEGESYFAEIGPDKTTEFIDHVIRLARRYNGNPGEVLHGAGSRVTDLTGAHRAAASAYAFDTCYTAGGLTRADFTS